MNKTYLKIFSLFTLLLFPLQAEEKKSPLLGKELVAEAKVGYEKGEYESFFSNLQTELERAGKAGLIKNLYEKLKSGAEKTEEKALDEESIRAFNEKLLTLCSKEPDLEICKRVDEIVFFVLPSEQEEALKSFKALRYKMPEGKEALSIEEKLSCIETRFRMALALLHIVSEKAGTDLETRFKKQTALSLEKFARMQKVAEKDPIWLEKIDLARRATEAKLVFQYEWRVLKRLGLAKTEAAGTTPSIEAEIAKLME